MRKQYEMADSLSPNRRSENMSRIRGKDTKPEIQVRSILHRLGYRFRLHDRKLPGTPDIVLPRFQTVVNVNGCFWHRHRNCKYAYQPKSRVDFWNKKFDENVARDRKNAAELKRLGWKVVTVWECELAKPDKLRRRLERLLS